MEKFVLVLKPRFDQKGYLYPREISSENAAINHALKLFNVGSLFQIVVIDQNMNIIFKETRRCECRHVQQYFDDNGRFYFKCESCGITIDHETFKEIIMNNQFAYVSKEEVKRTAETRPQHTSAAMIGKRQLVSGGSVSS